MNPSRRLIHSRKGGPQCKVEGEARGSAPCYLYTPFGRNQRNKEAVYMQRLIEVLTPAPPMKRKARYLCTLSFMAAMLVLGAAPAGAQDYSVPTYGPNGPYYGPYDYCVWSAYACKYY
jgi:hypothetical protein